MSREEHILRLHTTWNFYKSLGWRMHLLLDHFNFWLKRYGGTELSLADTKELNANR